MDRRRFLQIGASSAVLAFTGRGVFAEGMSGMKTAGSSSTKATGIPVPVLYKDVKNDPKQKWAIDVKPMTFKVGQPYAFQVKDNASGKHEFMVVDAAADAELTKMNADMIAMPEMPMDMSDMDEMPGVLGAIESDELVHDGKPATVTVVFKERGTYWAGCYMMDPIKDASGHQGYINHNAEGMRCKLVVV
jgi:uncharacterized cupredoxin-like copper-binding protein